MTQILTVGWPIGEAGDILNAYNESDILHNSITQWIITRGTNKWNVKKGATGYVNNIFLVPLILHNTRYMSSIGKGSRLFVKLSTNKQFIANGLNKRIYTIITTEIPPFRGKSPHLIKVLRFSKVS